MGKVVRLDDLCGRCQGLEVQYGCQLLLVVGNVGQGVVVQYGVEGLYGFVEYVFQVVVVLDGVVVGFVGEVFGWYCLVFGVVYDFVDVDLVGCYGQCQFVVFVVYGGYLVVFVEVVYDFGQVVGFDVEGCVDFGDGGVLVGCCCQVDQYVQVVVGENGEFYDDV